MIRITSKRHNFRRCGMPHHKGTTNYPDDQFSEEELKILEAEPMLTVERIKEAHSSQPIAQKTPKKKQKSKPKG